MASERRHLYKETRPTTSFLIDLQGNNALYGKILKNPLIR